MFLTIVAAATLPALPLAAAESDAGAADAPDFHSMYPADIVVTAPVAQSRLHAASAITVLQGENLARALRPSLGETLAHTAGISASSFGPVSSRPVLRGLQGERVLILTDGIGSIDASSASADHALAINPLLAERIEVVRGPQTLLFGPSAIGGVVNVLDRRIPRKVPDEAIHLQGNVTYGSAANERTGSLSTDIAIGPQIVLHADGSYQKTGNLRIGGHALSGQARAQALQSASLPPDQQVDADGEPVDFAKNASIYGRLPNSFGRNWTVGAGAAYITDGGSLGLSYSHLSNRYGVPLRYATRPGDEQEAPVIDLAQNRLDIRGEINADSPVLDAVKIRLGYASYRHFELEEDGTVGTTFRNKGIEGRIELVQAKRGRWTGATGGQVSIQDFDVTGDEAFLPKNSSTKLGLFTLQQVDAGALKLQAALRFERAILTALPQPLEPFAAGTRRFNDVSATIGASLQIADHWHLGGTIACSSRAPSAEDLYANGLHGGTQTYETGDPALRSERSWGTELVLRGKGNGYEVEASAYYSWYSSFIYRGQTGEIKDGLPVYQARQGKARYYGFELQGKADLFWLGDATVKLNGLADYVRATITHVGPAPQIPPMRMIAGIEMDSTYIDFNAEIEHALRQNKVAAHETPTNSYTLVNAEATIRPWGNARPMSLTLSASNLFNVNARRHASLLKDFAPLAGRDMRLTARFNF